MRMTFSDLKYNIISENNKCQVCVGGIIHRFLHIDNGICYSCNGTSKSKHTNIKYSEIAVRVIPAWSDLVARSEEIIATRLAVAKKIRTQREKQKNHRINLEKFRSELVVVSSGVWKVSKYTDKCVILENEKNEKAMIYLNKFKIITRVTKAVHFADGAEKKYNQKFEFKYSNLPQGAYLTVTKVDTKISGFWNDFDFEICSLKNLSVVEKKINHYVY